MGSNFSSGNVNVTKQDNNTAARHPELILSLVVQDILSNRINGIYRRVEGFYGDRELWRYFRFVSIQTEANTISKSGIILAVAL